MSRPQWPYGTDSWQVLTISEKGGAGIATQKIESALIRVARSPTWITVVVEQVAVPAGEDVVDQAGSYSVAGGGVCGALAIEIAHAAVTFVPVFTPFHLPFPPHGGACSPRRPKASPGGALLRRLSSRSMQESSEPGALHSAPCAQGEIDGSGI